MADRSYQMAGLIGFIVAGILFVITGWRFGDMLAVSGSPIWIVSCLIWMIPLFRKTPEASSPGED